MGKVQLYFTEMTEMTKLAAFKGVNFYTCTSNGGCRREEKSRKHWSLFTKLLSLVNTYFFFYQIKSRAIVCIDCTENQRKIGLSQMS